ncbi:hypothetical protein, partial [Rhodoblastus sp.]
RFPQDCFAIRGNAMARKSSMSRADFRASGIPIPNDSFGIGISRSMGARARFSRRHGQASAYSRKVDRLFGQEQASKQ